MSPFPFFRPADTRRRSARTSTDWSGWLLIILSLLGVMGAAAQTSPVVLRPALVATQAGAALQFNGQRDQGVVVPELPGSPFNFQGNYTVEAWVYVTSWTSRFQSIITKGDAWGIVRADESPNIAFRTARLGPVGGFHDLISPLPFPTGKWTHVAAVWNGQHKQLYVNGLLVGQQAYADGVLAVNFPVMIGGNAETNKADRTLNGIVDSVRIWGAARTGEELEIYNSENLLVAANLRGNEPGLLADWRFDEGAGTVARDSSAEGMHATLVPSKLVGQPGVLPQWVNGLALAPPPPGTLAIFFKNRTAQYGITGAGAAIQQVTFPQLEWPEQAGLRDGLTAEFWINPAAIPATGEVVLLSNGAEAWEVRYHHTGKIGFFTHQVQSTLPGGGNEQLSTARVEPLGWTHVAVVWDPAALEKRIYLNGVLDATTPVQVVLGAVWTPTEPVSIGAPTLIVPPLDRAFYGTLDELRLWSYVRPAADVVEDHLRRVNGSEPGLVGVWSFEEAGGPTTLDGSGRAVDGELTPEMSSLNRVEGMPLGLPRPGSYTVDLDGLSQYLTIPDQASLNGFTSMTLEAWIKPKEPKFPGFMMIVSKGEAGYGLALDADRYLRFMVSGNQDAALKSTQTVKNDEWNHVAVVVDGVAKTTTFYINGKPAGVLPSAVIPNSAGALCIGKVGGQTLTGFFHGGIDEVRVWGSALMPTDILLRAFNDLVPPQADLVGLWSFREGSGDSVADRSNPSSDSKKATLVNGGLRTWQPGPIFPDVPTLPADLNLTPNTRAAGLWIGEVVLTKVNEVQLAVNGKAEAVSATGREATLRIILHVDNAGRVRMLKEVIAMQTVGTGVPAPPPQPVLVTDPTQIHLYQGVVTRGGKRVGMRYSTVAFDFPGSELGMVGGIGAGNACAGQIDISENAPTNPYRHKYHPNHSKGYAITRLFSFEFDGTPGDPLKAAPGYGVDRITGIYRETIGGLHKIHLKTEGTVTLNRISTVPTLNIP